MIFSLDVRRARKGDCFLVHFGSKANPGLIMIDGGPASVFKPHLAPRIDEIRRARKLTSQDSLPVDVLMVSHADDDHIQGILDLTKDEIVRHDAQQPLRLNVLDFWHNSFDEIIGSKPDELTAMFTKQFGTASANGQALSDDKVREVEEGSAEHPEVVDSGLRVLASIAQGFQLRLDAAKLRYRPNGEFGGKLIIARKGAKPIDAGGGLELTIVGPMEREVLALHKKHQDWLKDLKKKGKSPPSALAAYVDPSVTNLSSIVVLGKVGSRRMLLTGDARGDKVLDGLEHVGLVKPGKALKVDVLKVPHHGSANNVDDDFFERIVAKHYVFSGNGEHGNPDRESLEMLFRARGKARFTVHLTYPVAEIDVERKKEWEKQRAREQKKKLTKPTTKVRPKWSAQKHGLVAFFANLKLAKGQRIAIADDGKAHVIDLIDPLGF